MARSPPDRATLEPGLWDKVPIPPKKLANPPASFFPFTDVDGTSNRTERYGAPMSELTPDETVNHAPKQGAAFFDLDRTLLTGASGPAISASLRSVGLLSDRSIPGQGVMFRLFNALGENLPSMLLARQAAAIAADWSRETAQRAGQLAAETLIDLVQPYAHVLIDEHRSAGRLVVMATTTPYDLVKPLADLLGFDAVIATRYGELDGKYDGTIAGEFVWSHGKFRAARSWASGHGVSLAASYAYSDSYYDVPLLNAVGHPVVVNPDPRMRVQALIRRWPTRYLDLPPGVPKLVGLEPQRLLFPFVRPGLAPYVDLSVSGTEWIPANGPAILCANHRSYFDVAAIGFAIAKTGRPVRFLGKKEVFDAPIVGDLARAMGGIRVERGTGSDEPLQEALSALEAGEIVVLMPQGTIPRGMGFFDPVLKARWGAARLAAMSGAPVIPIGLWGTEKVWPRNAKIPNLWNVTDPPTVTVRVGPRIDLELIDPEIDSEQIMAAIVDLLPEQARRWGEPTPEELAATMPTAVVNAQAARGHESARRPGVD